MPLHPSFRTHAGRCQPGCGCPVDVVQANRPLVDQAKSNIGAVKDLVPPPASLISAEGPPVRVFEFRSTCAQGEIVGITTALWSQNPGLDEAFFTAAEVFTGVRGRLTFGCGNGVVQDVEFDWMMGTRISVLAESCSVDAIYTRTVDPLVPLIDPYAGPPLRVAAWSGYGDTPRTSNAARLTDLAFPNGGDPFTLPIPPMAISFTLVPCDSSDVTAALRGFGLVGPVYGVVGSPITNVGQYNPENAFVIPNGARLLEVTCTEPCYVIWGLAL